MLQLDLVLPHEHGVELDAALYFSCRDDLFLAGVRQRASFYNFQNLESPHTGFRIRITTRKNSHDRAANFCREHQKKHGKEMAKADAGLELSSTRKQLILPPPSSKPSTVTLLVLLF
jgi:hypothetical protein